MYISRVDEAERPKESAGDKGRRLREVQDERLLFNIVHMARRYMLGYLVRGASVDRQDPRWVCDNIVS